MGFKIKSKIGRIAKRIFYGGGLSRRQRKSIYKRLGLTSKSKWLRQAKRSLGIGSRSVYSQPVSASDLGGYQYSGRTLSQLTGGV